MDMLLNVDIGRMRKLADFLETVPPEDFDLGAWQTVAPRDAIALGPLVFRKSCGFAGCAMGWAAHSKLFDGLRINREGDLCYRGSRGIEAATRVLGLTERTAEFLFWESRYPDGRTDPAHVATRLRRFASIVEARIAARSGAQWIKRITSGEPVAV